MKKLITLLSILLTLSAFSQAPQHYMSISMGGAIPQGNFASTDTTKGDIGYAQTSFSLAFDAAYFFLPSLGVAGTISFLNNAVNQVALRDNIIANIEKNYPDIEIPEDTQISFNFGAWNHVNFLVGPQLTIPFGSIYVDLRALAGVSWVFPPAAELYFANEEMDYRIYWDQRQSVNFGWDVGGGFRFDSGRNYIIKLGADYSSTKATFQVTDEISTPDNPNDGSTRDYTQNVATVQVMVGLGYYF